MHLARRTLLMTAAALPLGTARAQAWPARPITVVVPSTPGGVVDISARLVQPGLMAGLGQTVVVDNRPGAGGHIAGRTVARAAADGYTLLCSAGSILVSGVVRNLSYAPMTDLTPVCRLTLGGFVLLVAANSPYRTLADLIARGRAEPGKLTYASTSVGNSTHIGGEMLSLLAGMKAVHVPYKGNVQALADVAAGRIDFSIDSRPPALPLIRGGQLRALAVTNTERQPDFPDLPAIAEQLPGYGIEGWTGLFAPARTPAPIVDKIADAARRALSDPAVIQRSKDNGSEPAFLGPAEAAAFMKMDHERLNRVVREANIQAD